MAINYTHLTLSMQNQEECLALSPQEVRITLSPHVAKFLRYHFNNEETPGLLSAHNEWASFLLSLLRKTKDGYRLPEEYNFQMFIPSCSELRIKKIDIRYHGYYIPEKTQTRLNYYMRRFINYHYAVSYYETSRLAEKKIKEFDWYLEYIKKYGIDEEEFPYDRIHLYYWRFREFPKNPSKLLVPTF